MTLGGLRMHDDDGCRNATGGGAIAGIGVVAGRRCIVPASDSGIKGGTVPPLGLKKALRLHELAFENRLPLIYLVESGGANLLHRAPVGESRLKSEGGPKDGRDRRLAHSGRQWGVCRHSIGTNGRTPHALHTRT